MRAKGPLFIVGIGLCGMIGFGMLAHWMTSSPGTRSWIEFQKAFAEEYPDAEDITITHDGPTCRLQVTVKSDFTAALSGKNSELPEPYTGLAEFFCSSYSSPRVPHRLEIAIVREDDQPVATQTITRLPGSRAATVDGVRALLGSARFRLLDREDTRIRLVTREPVTAEKAEKIAKLLRGHLRRAWTEIHVEARKEHFHFTVDGSRVSLVKTTPAGGEKRKPDADAKPVPLEEPGIDE